LEIVENAGALEVEIFELLFEISFGGLRSVALGAFVLLAFNVF